MSVGTIREGIRLVNEDGVEVVKVHAVHRDGVIETSRVEYLPADCSIVKILAGPENDLSLSRRLTIQEDSVTITYRIERV